MEENVVSASGTEKMQATEIELQNAVIRAGFRPRRRNSRYELLDTPDEKSKISEMAAPPPIQFSS